MRVHGGGPAPYHLNQSLDTIGGSHPTISLCRLQLQRDCLAPSRVEPRIPYVAA
ncbi:hypothetical protein RHECNPAF_690014 [Rhizobium etli CNPAF512]|nr:hypothetical protein RHECNPAF_690014 [Rhizobium etli CNPAF512]